MQSPQVSQVMEEKTNYYFFFHNFFFLLLFSGSVTMVSQQRAGESCQSLTAAVIILLRWCLWAVDLRELPQQKEQRVQGAWGSFSTLLSHSIQSHPDAPTSSFPSQLHQMTMTGSLVQQSSWIIHNVSLNKLQLISEKKESRGKDDLLKES